MKYHSDEDLRKFYAKVIGLLSDTPKKEVARMRKAYEDSLLYAKRAQYKFLLKNLPDLATELGRLKMVCCHTSRTRCSIVDFYLALRGTYPKCKGCGRQDYTVIGNGHVKTYCSIACLNTSEHAWSKRRNTTKERYGEDNFFKSRAFEANKPKYFSKYGEGVTNPSQVEEFQEKKKLTALAKHGETHHMKSKKFVEKFRKELSLEEDHFTRMNKIAMKNYFTRTGFSNPGKNPEVQDKMAATCFERHGVENYFQSIEFQENRNKEAWYKKVKRTCRLRYGVDWMSQSPDVQRKIKRSAFSFKEIKVRGKTLFCQGHEPHVLLNLAEKPNVLYLDTGVSHGVCVPYKNVKGCKAMYFPDLVCVTRNNKFVIEVKSAYTLAIEENIWRKFRAAERECNKRHMTFMLAVYENDFVHYIENPTKNKKEVRSLMKRVK